jgi:PPOX class probable F420-dependent enzyme
LATLRPDDPAVRRFFTERHLATLTLHRPDGSLQVTPVGVTLDAASGLARVITWAGSYKARTLAADPGDVALCQVDGRRWLALYGSAEVTDDPDRVAVAVALYRQRYRPPKERPDRVAIEITMDRMVGNL